MTIDNQGNLIENNNYIGFYDSLTGECKLFDGTLVVCPNIPTTIQQNIVQDKPTYYWLLLVLFSLLVVFIAWYINR